MLGSFWALPPPRQQSGVSGHHSYLPCAQQGPQFPPPQAWIRQRRLLFFLKDSDGSSFKLFFFFFKPPKQARKA